MSENSEEKKEKKSLGSFFSNLIFENKPETAPVEAVVNNQSAAQPMVQATAAPVAPISYNVNSLGTVNPEIYGKLKEILKERNLPGPDYLEVKNSMDAMKSYIPDENQRLQASFATIKASSPKLTKAIVIESVDEYVKFIKKECEIAQSESDKVYEDEVTSRQTKIDGKLAEIESAKAEIERLGQVIVSASQEINTISSEKLNKQTELEIKKKDFEVTVNAIIAELESDKLKVQTLINE